MAKKKAAPVAGEVSTPAEAKRALEPRIYEVMDSESGKLRMIETTSQARAIRYCSKDRYSIKVASSRDVARNMAAGVTVEIADPEPSEPQT